MDADYVLQMAERIEQNGRGFYLLAADRARDASARQMMLWLAEAESQHEQTFAKMREDLAQSDSPAAWIQPDDQTVQYVEALTAGRFFDPPWLL